MGEDTNFYFELIILEIHVYKNMLIMLAAGLDTCPNSSNPSAIVLLIAL